MINRRNLVGAGLLGAAGAAATFANPKSGEALSGPAIARSRRRFNMVTTWPKGLPGLGRAAERVSHLNCFHSHPYEKVFQMLLNTRVMRPSGRLQPLSGL